MSEGQSIARPINTNNLAGWANQFGGQECNVTGSAPDIQNTHAGRNTRFDQILSCDRVDQQPLTTQALQFVS